MPDYLLDTGILIRELRDRPGFRTLLDRLGDEADVYVSAYTRVEILQGMREHERHRTFTLLNDLLTHSLDRETADVAGELLRTWRDRGVTLGGADAVIAASALRLGATLVTTNPRHFPMRELAVLAADEEGRITPVTR